MEGQILPFSTNMTAHLGFQFAYLHLYIGTLLKVKVKHISTVNISKMTTDRVKVNIAIKYEVAYELSIFRFDLGQF